MASRKTTREKILNAASELAREEGSAHLSLQAVAARAGISKGGLLYNFPTKSALLKALVQQYIDQCDTALKKRVGADKNSFVAAEYFRFAMEELEKKAPPPSGVLAAFSEDPELFAPVRKFNRDLLDRMKSESTDETTVLLTFLVLEGMRAQKLFGTDVLRAEERALLLDRLNSILALK